MRPRLLAALPLVLAQDGGHELGGGPPVFEPRVEPASGEGLAAMAGFEAPEGFVSELVAAEPWIANPVCLDVDHAGDLYVAETFRHHAGVTDIREKYHLMERDVANRTVADRVAMLREDAGEAFEATYGRAIERVTRIRDTDGDGTYDEHGVFAAGFDDPAAGIAAGVLSYRGDVFYACIPDLWRLRDADGDGVAEERTVLSTGYGVNVAMLGHDLHGLVLGPDLRLYFSCGDRGFHVETPAGVIDHAHAGGVLRCELDGSGLEVFATGLRNPQELVFDDLGDLFTGDNNSDGGDRARWVHVLEDGDSGWRYGYQWLEAPLRRGPWNDEKLWHPHHPGQAAYLNPPVANLGAGPSGVAYDPGTGLPEAYRRHFFLCDFRGEPSISGIHAFDLRPRGAGWALGEVERFLWGTLATDAGFGPDGALYSSDWVAGWEKTGKGRVYRTYDPEARAAPAAREAARLLGEGLDGRPAGELRRLLGHADRRVRQEAEFALVRSGEPGVRALRDAAADASAGRLARLHALWGLGAADRLAGGAWRDRLASLLGLLSDADDEVRAQAARVLAEAGLRIDTELLRLLEDPAPRARYAAARGLARLEVRTPEAVAGLLDLLEEAGEDDPVLRHGAVTGLVGCTDDATRGALVERTRGRSADVRRGVAVVLRRAGDPRVAELLGDDDPLVVEEAARAIHDVPIEGAWPALARGLDAGPFETNVVVRRALEANFRLGGPEESRRVARFAADGTRATAHRLEALERLSTWREPPGRDGVTGEWRPLAPREAAGLPDLVRELAPLGSGEEPELAVRWIELAAELQLVDFNPELFEWAGDPRRPVGVRLAALAALEDLRPVGLATLARDLLADPEGAVRARALAVLERVSPEDLAPVLAAVVRTGELGERRAAYAALGRIPDAAAEATLLAELERDARGLVPGELRLDLVLAAEARDTPALRAALEARAAARGPDPEVEPYLDALLGGDAARGKRVFESAEASCTRCHRVDHQTGTEVGPDLRGVGGRLTRYQLVASIADPNRRLTPGYQSWTFLLESGEIVAGRIVEESADGVLRLQGSDSQFLEIHRDEIEVEKESLSAMPENLVEQLSREEMRDLVEYLCSI